MNFLTNWTIDIEKIPKYTNFSGRFTQPLDKQIIGLILKSDNPIFTQETKEELKRCIFDNIQNDGNLTVTHYQAKHLGRFYAKDNKSIIPMLKNIKHTIFHFMQYSDLDQTKGHPTIAAAIGDLNGENFKNIKQYIYNFEEKAKELIDYYSLENGTKLNTANIKDLFNIMIYGGSFNTWKNDLLEDKPKKGYKRFQIQHEKEPHKFVTYFKNECKKLHGFIISNNTELANRLHNADKTQHKNNNSTCAYWFQIIENHALYIAYNFLVKEGVITAKKCGLEYDGLCIPPNGAVYDKQTVLNKLNIHIVKKFGIPIVYKWKEYDKKYIVDEIIKMRENEEDNILTSEEMIDVNDSDYVFEQMAPEFEKTHALIINIASYIKETDEKIIIFNECIRIYAMQI